MVFAVEEGTLTEENRQEVLFFDSPMENSNCPILLNPPRSNQDEPGVRYPTARDTVMLLVAGPYP